MQHVTQPSRRQFLKQLAAGVGGLSLGIWFNPLAADTGMARPGNADAATLRQGNFAPNAFILISPDNTVTVLSKHLEMGQGSYTGMATLVAEELDADWAQIRTESAPANAALYNNLAFGPLQGTGGSTSMANAFMQMRKAGAAARAMLVAAAAQQWGVPAKDITVKAGMVSHASSGKQATFGALAQAARAQAIPDIDDTDLKDPSDFVYIGKQDLRRVDTSGKVNGTATFTQDIHFPNMLTAVVAHPPLFGATVNKVDAQAALALKGVVDVIVIPTGVAVLGHDFWSAKQGRDALQITWDDSKAYKGSSDALLKQYHELAKQPGITTYSVGEIKDTLPKATKRVQASYDFPYLSHAPMEPLNCVVHLTNQGCEIWNGAQLHTLDQAAVAKVLGIEPAQVKINTLFAGGSFGRRGNPLSDYVVEAAHIAHQSNHRVPIKLVWTREDDMQRGYYRPLFHHQLEARLDADGQLVAWQQRVVGQSIMAGTPMAAMMQKGFDESSVEGAAEPYAIPNIRVELHTPTDVGVPVQWWRSVGHTHTGFATEAFLDEVAHAAGQDPLAFRRTLLKEHPRHLNVLELAAEKANWGSDLPKGRGRGIAVVKSFNSYVAEVAEVTVKDDGSFQVDKVVLAVDCGLPINPDVIQAQMVGGVGFALSAILGEQITLKDGKVEQSNFHQYPLLRMSEMPQIEVHIVPSAEPPSGVGEPGVPPLGPAVANALFAATGKRHYQLPLGRTVQV